MIQKIFIWTSPLPLLLFWGLWIYVKQVDGWGQLVANLSLVAPILLSLLMGILGLVLIVRARKQKAPVANLWFSTLMAGSIALYILVKGAVQQLAEVFG